MSLQEFLILVIILAVLSMTGILPHVVRALRELRGESVPEPPGPSTNDLELSYRLLGVSPSTPWDEVERAYRRKAHVHHPDHGGDEDAMRALNEAYRLIKKARGR